VHDISQGCTAVVNANIYDMTSHYFFQNLNLIISKNNLVYEQQVQTFLFYFDGLHPVA
jgi:hypothetical protein